MKPVVVVDTNVPVVTNKKSEQAGKACVEACIERLERIVLDEEKLLVDDDWHIFSEYQDNLTCPPDVEPGFGHEFLIWVLSNRQNLERLEYVHITSVDQPEGSFAEFPPGAALANFDLADRKFVAVALAHPQRPPILQAVDPKWWLRRGALRAGGVTVEFLCPEEIERLSHS